MPTYTFGSPIGKGQFGEVLNGTSETGQAVAIKRFSPPPNSTVTQAELVKRFHREVKIQHKFSNPSIVKVHAYNLTDFPPWFVMELANGTLRELMNSNALTTELQNKALFDVLNGLEAIHDKGYAHRDLKPENILYFSDSGGTRFAISDFGLGVNHGGNSTTLTGTGVQGGTLTYAAPECYVSFRQATFSADIYSFGCLLHDFYVGTARTPFSKQTGPGPIGKIIEKCTQKYPGKRYTKIKDLRADLLVAIQSDPTKPPNAKDIRVMELLQDWGNLTEDELEYIFLRMDEIADAKTFNSEILHAMKAPFIKFLQENHPEYVAALCKHMVEFNVHREGALDFGYCDVLCDKMIEIFDCADLSGKAEILLSLLILGTRHNRWYVERHFCSRAGVSAETALIQRMLDDADDREIDLTRYIRHLPNSIHLDPKELHHKLQIYFLEDAA